MSELQKYEDQHRDFLGSLRLLSLICEFVFIKQRGRKRKIWSKTCTHEQGKGKRTKRWWKIKLSGAFKRELYRCRGSQPICHGGL